MKPERRRIEVCADWVGIGGPVPMGVLHATPVRGKQMFSFEYDAAWLRSPHAQVLDPTLQLYRGAQHPPADKDNFGLFLDSAPDRWGRTLMKRREALLAKEGRRPERPLMESDYLLGVHDGHRMGALRFRLDSEGAFLDDATEMAAPPWTSIRELQQASLALERDDAEADPSYASWLRTLMVPGASLGGARPKADVLDPHGALWIAKFPGRRDQKDVGAWEAVLHQLARAAGVVTSETRLEKFASSRHRTFLTRRFDRGANRSRVHFASAMTLLGRAESDADDASYLELAELVTSRGATPRQDLEQLWRRIVFFMCVSNTDDHLRNHGFLLGPGGWSLAPAYDLNPDEDGEGLRLNVSETDNSQDLELAQSVAASFRINGARAKEIIAEVVAVVSTWRAVAGALAVPGGEQAAVARAFRLATAPASA